MAKIPFFNDSDRIKHVGPVMIPPCETRTVEDTHLPTWKPEKSETIAEVDPIEALQALNVKQLLSQLSDLSDVDLAALDVLEQSQKKPRDSIIKRIAEIQLQRAAESSDVEQFAAKLETHSDEMLIELAELHQDDEQLLSLIVAEQGKRAAEKPPE